MPARAALAFFACTFAITTDEAVDLILVLVDHSLDLLATRTRLWSGIGNSAAETNVVANEFLTLRILERVLDVSLFHLEVTVDITTVVRLPAFRHLMMLRLCWSASLIFNKDSMGKPQAFGPSRRRCRNDLSLDEKDQIASAFPETLGIANPQAIVVGVHSTVP